MYTNRDVAEVLGRLRKMQTEAKDRELTQIVRSFEVWASRHVTNVWEPVLTADEPLKA